MISGSSSHRHRVGSQIRRCLIRVELLLPIWEWELCRTEWQIAEQPEPSFCCALTQFLGAFLRRGTSVLASLAYVCPEGKKLAHRCSNLGTHSINQIDSKLDGIPFRDKPAWWLIQHEAAEAGEHWSLTRQCFASVLPRLTFPSPAKLLQSPCRWYRHRPSATSRRHLYKQTTRESEAGRYRHNRRTVVGMSRDTLVQPDRGECPTTCQR